MAHSPQLPTPADNQLCLLLDASGPAAQTGLRQGGRWLSFAKTQGEALKTIFSGADACLRESGKEISGLEGFIYCEGPGSVLGVRLTVMAIEGWLGLPGRQGLPVRSYRSLDAGAALLQNRGVSPPFHIISEFRKDRWFHMSVPASGPPGEIKAAAETELQSLKEPVYWLRQRLSGIPPPVPCQPLEYDLRELPSGFGFSAPAGTAPSFPVFSAGAAGYVKWRGGRHRRA